jgi:hypothetical protein
MKSARWIVVLLAFVIACGGAAFLGWHAVQGRPTALGVIPHRRLSQPRIYAYRDWQSVGVRVDPGDLLHIRAQGEWLYTPDEYHGPEGHATYPAPNTYPVPGGTPGGILLVRIGESGTPMIVGRGRTLIADHDGLLYFRINDDILSDNEGYVTVEVVVESPTPTP